VNSLQLRGYPRKQAVKDDQPIQEVNKITKNRLFKTFNQTFYAKEADRMDKYELVKKEDEWKFRQMGSERSIRTFETKEEGLDFGTDYMNDHGGTLKIKRENGTIQEERTYPRSADPRKTPG
jgi:hypothetical protein